MLCGAPYQKCCRDCVFLFITYIDDQFEMNGRCNTAHLNTLQWNIHVWKSPSARLQKWKWVYSINRSWKRMFINCTVLCYKLLMIPSTYTLPFIYTICAFLVNKYRSCTDVSAIGLLCFALLHTVYDGFTIVKIFLKWMGYQCSLSQCMPLKQNMLCLRCVQPLGRYQGMIYFAVLYTHES